MDNGANMHMFCDFWLFTNYEKSNDLSYVTAAGGQQLSILGYGDIGNLTNVLHVAGIVKNLISLTYLALLGCSYFGQYNFCDLFDVNNKLTKDGRILDDLQDELYILMT